MGTFVVNWNLSRFYTSNSDFYSDSDFTQNFWGKIWWVKALCLRCLSLAYFYIGKITEKIFRCFRYLSMAWYRILEQILNKRQPLDVLDIWVWPHIKSSHSARGKSNIRKICGSDAKLQKFRFPRSHRVDMSGISEFLCLSYQGVVWMRGLGFL